MPIEETTALIAGIAVIAGTVSGGLIGLATERWRAGRETIQRVAERQAARDDLQRSTLLELQDAIGDWMVAVGSLEDWVRDAEVANKTWAELRGSPLGEPQKAEQSARVRMLKLVERVRDDQLRGTINAFIERGITTILRSDSYEQFWAHYKRFIDSHQDANKALGIELRKLL